MRISDWSSDVCSSDLLARLEEGKAKTGGIAAGLDDLPLFAAIAAAPRQETKDAVRDAVQAIDADALSPRRSEEHTSELQSLMRISYAVFCLKKKTKKTYLQKQSRTTTNIKSSK